MGEIDDASPATWRTTRIVYPSPAARHALVVDALHALDEAAVAPWFWVDLRRATDRGEPGVIEVAIAAHGGGVPTEWFRTAVERGLVERADAVERSEALDPGLFPQHRVPAAYASLLSATSRTALVLLRGDGSQVGRSWTLVRDEVAAIYEALVPEPAFRREALLEYAQWLERTVARDGLGNEAGFGSTPVLEEGSSARYAELGSRLRSELDREDLVVSVGRIAHTQVLRLRPDDDDDVLREVRIARDLAARTDGRSNAAGPRTRAPITTFDHAIHQLTLVCEAVGASSERGVALLRAVAPGCGDRDAAAPPRWSCLGDDCSPFEISLATSRAGYEVRFLIEAQSDPATPAGYWDAGGRLTRRLGEQLGLDLDRFDAVADLFGPATPDAFWSMWHGVDLRDTPVVKVYLNPSLGRRSPPTVVREVLTRLGFASAWPAVEAATGQAMPSHISLDLDGEGSRVKVYLRHEHGAVGSLTNVPRAISETAAGDFATVCAVMIDDASALVARPAFTTLYFAEPGADTPARVALHLPVQTYVPDDSVAARRIRSLLESFGLDSDGYARAHAALSAPSLLTRGLNSYVGFQRGESGPRVTTYFGARLYAERHGWPARTPRRAWSSPAH
jgi:Tryptophan dimethylallyltransferase